MWANKTQTSKITLTIPRFQTLHVSLSPLSLVQFCFSKSSAEVPWSPVNEQWANGKHQTKIPSMGGQRLVKTSAERDSSFPFCTIPHCPFLDLGLADTVGRGA
jgi:hypothetical protein